MTISAQPKHHDTKVPTLDLRYVLALISLFADGKEGGRGLANGEAGSGGAIGNDSREGAEEASGCVKKSMGGGNRGGEKQPAAGNGSSEREVQGADQPYVASEEGHGSTADYTDFVRIRSKVSRKAASFFTARTFLR